MKKFMEITTHLPFVTEYGERPATVMVKSHMGGQVTITFAEGSPQGKELHKLLCNEQIESFHMSVMEASNANGVVVVEPEAATPGSIQCVNHNPVQHRDGLVPWCDECKLDANFDEPTGPPVPPAAEGRDVSCPNHNPVQHRDTCAPWCNACGLTARFEKPIGLRIGDSRSR